MLAGVRQAIRAESTTLMLGVVLVLLVVTAVASSASVTGGGFSSDAGAVRAARPVGGAIVAAITAMLVVCVALVGLIVYAAAPRRRGKKSPEDVPWVSQPPVFTWLEKALGVALPLLLLAGLVTTVVLLSRGSHSQPPSLPVATGAPTPTGAPLDLSSQSSVSDNGTPWVEAGLIAGAVLVCAGVLAVFVLPRLKRRPSGPVPIEKGSARATVAGAVSLSLDDLRREPDPRRAIVAAYARMERTFAGAGLPREAHDTSTEYLRRILTASSAPSDALLKLTLLFQEARFSRHELTSHHRDGALDALTKIREAMVA
jgi:hypothetical protein